ncbi:hypothetical protein ACFQBQ_00720 [Granulicella cerasi]|uniref:Uncharacterized protein n=1 Tax=Granulicella cerasi TaxID=741063 RepID=A0ABW1Z6U3_9BACT|nr:hypothetical protein [Granulicella cerasi]
MVIDTFQGVSVLAFPTSPAPKQIELTMNNVVAAPTNPFTGSTQQVLAWPGGDFWSAQIAMPKLTPQQIPTWQGFLAECRGKLNTFLIGDPSYKHPQGTVKGVPVVNGAQSAMATTLSTKGWTPNSYRLLLPGDYLQVGYRLHRVIDVVNSDANGDATISLWPSLREAVTDGQAIILNNPRGLFRMSDNKQSITIDETRYGALTLTVVEAR